MPTLPIEAVVPQIQQTLQHNNEMVLEAPPGAGKTTRVPISLLDESWLAGQKIIVLEPRRIAARAAADRMAQLLNEQVGETVGYRVRMEKKVSTNTRIEVVTEGILNRMLQDDPSLDGVGLVIFDEFHERSLDADLGLALSLQGRELFSDLREHPLKILVMSATLDGLAVSRLLNDAPMIRSEGQSFPVDIQYIPAPAIRSGNSRPVRISDRVARCIEKVLNEDVGSVLVFLPGQGEIRQVERLLEESLTQSGSTNNIQVTPLYGSLSLSDQRKAIEAPATGIRKVVLTTSIAETSLTIEGIRIVIDSGLSRLPEYDPKTAMTRLKTEKVSAAAAKQRAGRAGRLEAGICYRLWSEDQQQSLANFTLPEIEQADLTPLALQLFNWGITNTSELTWMTPPAAAPFSQATDLLRQLGALNANELTLTKHGKAMATLPMHPRLAHMLVSSLPLGASKLACQIAALLSERDPLSGRSAQDNPSDLMLRLSAINGDRKVAPSTRGLIKRIQSLAQQFQRLLSKIGEKETPSSDYNQESLAAILVALAYPDRIAAKTSEKANTLKLSNGRQVELSESDSLCRYQQLAIAQLGGNNYSNKDKVYLAIPLNIDDLEEVSPTLFEEVTLVEWSDQQSRLIAEKQRFVGKLLLERTPLTHIPDDDKNLALLQLLQKKGLSLLPWTDDLKTLCQRVELIRRTTNNHVNKDNIHKDKFHKDNFHKDNFHKDNFHKDNAHEGNAYKNSANNWPDMSDRGLLAELESWLLPFMNDISHLNHFKKLDLKSILQTRLSWQLTQKLDEQVPERIAVPSGSRIRIDYSQNPPILAVKLQEMFGLQDTPTIANGKIKLLVHLLSPARRPLQVTQDLAGFWKSSYIDVKKDMKGRYPKHNWPDNPLEAIPTARAKPRKR